MFESKSRQYYLPLESGEHLELDTSKELGKEDVHKYQSMIVSLQWPILLGRLDICIAIMTLSLFRVSPQKGHLKRVQCIYGYIVKSNYPSIRIYTEKIEYIGLNWEKPVYG